MKAGRFAPEVAKLLRSKQQDDISNALAAAGAQAKLPTILRRPAAAAAFALACLSDDEAAFADDIAKRIGDDLPTEVEVVITK